MGVEKQRLYWVYHSMIQRCKNPNDKAFVNYGGRGIHVCGEWTSSFEVFLDDMGPRFPGACLERKNNDIGYSKDNCYWATRLENNNNRRMCIIVNIKGERMTLKQAWRKHSPKGLTYRALHKRITARHWNLQRAIFTDAI